MTDYAAILRQHASTDVIAANPEYFDAEELSAAVSGSTTGHVSVPYVPKEDEEQAAFVVWCRLHEDEYPGLDMMHSIPNGGYRPKRTGATLKQTGLRSGIPDICIPVGLNGYNHLYIEMKRRDPKLSVVSTEQSDIIQRLRELGNYVAICFGCSDAINVVKRYYEGNV